MLDIAPYIKDRRKLELSNKRKTAGLYKNWARDQGQWFSSEVGSSSPEVARLRSPLTSKTIEVTNVTSTMAKSATSKTSEKNFSKP